MPHKINSTRRAPHTYIQTKNTYIYDTHNSQLHTPYATYSIVAIPKAANKNVIKKKNLFCIIGGKYCGNFYIFFCFRFWRKFIDKIIFVVFCCYWFSLFVLLYNIFFMWFCRWFIGFIHNRKHNLGGKNILRKIYRRICLKYVLR